MMKELPKYRVIRAYGTFRKGQIIQPTGMLRDELIFARVIEKVVEEKKPEPVVEPPAPAPEKVQPEVATRPVFESTARFGRDKRRGR